MTRLLAAACLILILAGCAPPTTPESTSTPAPPTPPTGPTATPGPLFSLVGDAPIITRVSADWEGDFIYPAGMIYHEGLFYFFRVSSQFEGQTIGYHTSPDLETWTPGPNNPLIDSSDLPSPNQQFLPWSILIDADGTWLMYFWRWNRNDSRGAWIGRATAPGPEGPWIVDDTRLLEPDGGAWDNAFIQSPSVLLLNDGTYAMMYQGSGSSPGPGDDGLGWATSQDGVEWTRHGDLVFERAESGAWDGEVIQQGHMVYTPDGFVMLYDGMGEGSGYGIATSADGITWARHPENPVISLNDFPDAAFTHISNIFYHDGTYYLLLEIANADGSATDIWLATHEGSIVR
jgi:hypothetical protein